MKKGTFVKFIGTDKLRSVKTYVYGLTADKVLIEHPDGEPSTDPAVKKHLLDNYNLTVDKPLKFIEVSSTELICLNADGTEKEQVPALPEKQEEFVDEMVMVQMPKSLLFYLRDSAIQQKKIVNGDMDDVPVMLKPLLKGMMSMMKKDKDANEVHDQVIGALNESISKMIPVKDLLEKAPDFHPQLTIAPISDETITEINPQPETTNQNV